HHPQLVEECIHIIVDTITFFDGRSDEVTARIGHAMKLLPGHRTRPLPAFDLDAPERCRDLRAFRRRPVDHVLRRTRVHDGGETPHPIRALIADVPYEPESAAWPDDAADLGGCCNRIHPVPRLAQHHRIETR